MATLTLSTPLRGSGRFPAPPSPTPIMLGFGQFLSAADDLILAEIDLAGHQGHDPAVDAWFTAAEMARDTVLYIINAVMDLTVVDPGDDHLVNVLDHFQRVMQSQNPDEISQLDFQIAEMPQRYLALGLEGIDGYVNRLVLQGLDRFEQYLLAEEVISDAEALLHLEDEIDLSSVF